MARTEGGRCWRNGSLNFRACLVEMEEAEAVPLRNGLTCIIPGVAGRSGERGSQNFYVNGSQAFAVLLLTP